MAKKSNDSVKCFKVTVNGWETKADAEEGDGDVSKTVTMMAKSKEEIENIQTSPKFKLVAKKLGLYDFFVVKVEERKDVIAL